MKGSALVGDSIEKYVIIDGYKKRQGSRGMFGLRVRDFFIQGESVDSKHERD